MSRARLVLPLAAAAVVVIAAAPVRAETGWEKTGLRFSLADKLLDEAGCLKDEQRFLGCVHAVGTVLAATAPELALVPAAAIAAGDQVRRRFGPLVVVARSIPAGRRALADRQRLARRELEGWRASYRDRDETRIPLGEVVAWLREAHVPAAREAELAARAVMGFLQTMRDPWNRLIPTLDDELTIESTGAARVGVGISVVSLLRSHIVRRVLPEGPAARAGLAAGDALLAVDGWYVGGVDRDALMRMLAGPEGSEVTLRWRRGSEVREATVERQRFEVAHAYGRMGRSGDEAAGAIGVIRIRTFMSEHVCEQTREAVAGLRKAGAKALVLDLRGNPGGLIEEAVCVADLLLGPDVTVASIADPTHDRYRRRFVTAKPAATELPAVVLVDASSQSAAEILAGALREAGRATVVGQRTFGKGTIQDAFPWAEGMPVTVYRTVGRYVLGSGAEVHLAGVRPDVPVSRRGEVGAVDPAPRAGLAYLEALKDVPKHAAGPKAAAETSDLAKCAAQSRAWRLGDAGAEPQLGAALNVARCLAERSSKR